MKEQPVSQKRIAEEAGVSIMTVSRVLRGKGDVAEDTRDRVLEVARKHRYRPNLLVQGIQTGKTRTVGVLLPTWWHFYNILGAGIHDGLLNRGHVPITVWAASEATDKSIDANELTQIHRLLDRRVDGVILKPLDEAVSDEYLREVWERGVPLVVIDRELPKTHADFVGTDDRAGGRLAAEYLLELGHRNLVHLALDGHVSTYASRRKGFEEAVNTVPDARCVIVPCVQEEEAMRASAQEVLASTPRPTAMFVPTDHAAAMVYQMAYEMGVRIPEDFSLVGFGNLGFSSYLGPKLTTLEQFPYEQGRKAARLLLDRAAGALAGQDPVRLRLKPELLVRGSTGPPPGTART